MNTGRFIEWRGDFLMGLALGVGRVSEFFDRISTGLHVRAMRDLSHSLEDELSAEDNSSALNGLAVPDLSHDDDFGTLYERFSPSTPVERENEHEQRPDRGWQPAGKVMQNIVRGLRVVDRD